MCARARALAQRDSTYKQYPLIFPEFNLGSRAHPRAHSLLSHPIVYPVRRRN